MLCTSDRCFLVGVLTQRIPMLIPIYKTGTKVRKLYMYINKKMIRCEPIQSILAPICFNSTQKNPNSISNFRLAVETTRIQRCRVHTTIATFVALDHPLCFVNHKAIDRSSWRFNNLSFEQSTSQFRPILRNKKCYSRAIPFVPHLLTFAHRNPTAHPTDRWSVSFRTLCNICEGGILERIHSRIIDKTNRSSAMSVEKIIWSTALR
jgi:hypothetical protein